MEMKKMLLSDIQRQVQDEDIIEFIEERAFDRFSRTTSVSQDAACVFVGAKKYISTIPSNAAMVITTEEIAQELRGKRFGICISKSPRATFFRMFSAASEIKTDKEETTVIGQGCRIGEQTSISKTNVKIGNNVVIENFVTIYKNVTIGDNCIIRSGARIGVKDYNYYEDNGALMHLPHYGYLIIQDNVEIGFNSVVGRSLYPEDVTVIGEGSKLANCCAVGHDCVLGKRVMIYAGVMLAGYVTIGDDTHITLNASVRNGIHIGKNVRVDMGSVVIRDIPDNETVFGNPARRVVVPN